jgi:hypothetical protein
MSHLLMMGMPKNANPSAHPRETDIALIAILDVLPLHSEGRAPSGFISKMRKKAYQSFSSFG